jgi:hypothetical protein
MNSDTLSRQGVTTISTTPQQALSGTEIGLGPMAQCSTCARSIGEGSAVALRAHRLSDEARWTVAAVHCQGCIETHGEIDTPTPGAVELVLAGRLAVRGDVSAQDHRLVFNADDGRDAVLDYASADGDTRAPEQPEAVRAWRDRQ